MSIARFPVFQTQVNLYNRIYMAYTDKQPEIRDSTCNSIDQSVLVEV